MIDLHCFWARSRQHLQPLPPALTLLLCLLLCPPRFAGAQPMGSRDENFLYRVEGGDTLEALARRYTLQALNWPILQDLNRVDDPYQLPIGKVLRIPLRLIPRDAASANILHVTGEVRINGRAVAHGAVLYAGDQLQTGAAGSATLQLSDASLLTLEPDSMLEITHLQSFRGTGLLDGILTIRRGVVESVVAPENTGVGRFEVRTPAIVTGVRGTRLRVRDGTRGSRLEVLQGQAAVDSPGSQEQIITTNEGAAYDTRGQLLGTRPLLPAPELPAQLAPGQYQLDFPPVPHAVAYRIQIFLDATGTQLQSEQRVSQPSARLAPRGAGTRYIFVNAIDSLGIEGRDAVLTLHLPAGLTTSDGRPVLSGDGTPIALDRDGSS